MTAAHHCAACAKRSRLAAPSRRALLAEAGAAGFADPLGGKRRLLRRLRRRMPPGRVARPTWDSIILGSGGQLQAVARLSRNARLSSKQRWSFEACRPSRHPADDRRHRPDPGDAGPARCRRGRNRSPQLKPSSASRTRCRSPSSKERSVSTPSTKRTSTMNASDASHAKLEATPGSRLGQGACRQRAIGHRPR